MRDARLLVYTYIIYIYSENICPAKNISLQSIGVYVCVWTLNKEHFFLYRN